MSHTRARTAASPLSCYLADIGRAPTLTAGRERELARRVARGDAEARDELVCANLRLVVGIARRYSKQGLPLEDLIGEGNLGLLRAVEGVDPDATVRFATYASFWIRQSIRAAVCRGGRAVRLPHHLWRQIGKWQRAAGVLVQRLGRWPTEEAVAAELGLSPRQTRAMHRGLRVHRSTGEGAGALLNVVPESDERRAEGALRIDLDRVGPKALAQLSPREATVLRLRFGLNGEEPASLREVGGQIGCTAEWVRRIEHAALTKLRRWSGADGSAAAGWEPLPAAEYRRGSA